MDEHLHGLAAGGYRPQRPDWTIDQDWPQYTAAEHDVWRRLHARQRTLLPGRACGEFIRGMNELPLSPDRIPDFAQLNAVLMNRSGWQVVAVPGLVPDAVFFEHLAHRRFPAGRFIRKPHQLDYLREPDVFHDVFGHVPMLMNPVMAEFIQAYGKGGLRALEKGVLQKLARVYWYTVEFGLVQESGGLRIYGAGIASSAAESAFATQSDSPNRLRFDLARVMRTEYRIDDFQETYFVLQRLEDLLSLARIDFDPWYEQATRDPDCQPADILPGDAVLSRGTGEHHAGRCQTGAAASSPGAPPASSSSTV